MKRRIFRSLTAIAAAAVVCTLLLALWIFHAWAVRDLRQALAVDCRVLAQAVESSSRPPRETLAAMAPLLGEVRATLIRQDGAIDYDSAQPANPPEEPLQCPAVREARNSGWGESRCPSGTLGRELLCCAARLPDGGVLRVSLQQQGILPAVAPLLPALGVILAALLCAATAAASRITQSILRPVAAVCGGLDGPAPQEVYRELAPFLEKIQGQQRMIRRQMEELADDRGTIKAITDNMREGLVMVSTQKSILSVNSSAIRLLEAQPGSYTGRDIGELSRLPQLEEAISAALDGRGSSLTVGSGRRFCRLFANPVYLEEQLSGAILLILDDTEREKGEKLRRDFSANVSHELRTPLTSISGFAEMIETGMAAGEDARKFAGQITREAARLQALIDDIIRLSRLDEHAPTPMGRVCLTAICREVLESLEVVARRRGVALALTGPEVWVWGNAGMLTELMTNLCDNAIKYNREGGSVTVETAAPGGATAAVTVRDTGIGIPEASFQRVFERFYRVDKSRSKRTGGTGLGLSIAKHLVECHGGGISLSSRLGEGSAFTVTLPAAE